MNYIYLATNTLKGRSFPFPTTTNKKQATILLIGGKKVKIGSFPNLRAIYKTGIGIDNLPLSQAKNKKICVGLPSKKTQKIIFEETASFACHLILKSLYTDLGSFKKWNKRKRTALSNQTLLIMGNGHIGNLVKVRMKRFLIVKTYDPKENNPKQLPKLIRKADCVSLHMPLLSSTNRFFDKRRLSWMKDGACLVNTSRGAIVDEISLLREIQNHRISAALDVFWSEPYQGKLLALRGKRLFCTPHVASTCNEFLDGVHKDFVKFCRAQRTSHEKN